MKSSARNSRGLNTVEQSSRMGIDSEKTKSQFRERLVLILGFTSPSSTVLSSWVNETRPDSDPISAIPPGSLHAVGKAWIMSVCSFKFRDVIVSRQHQTFCTLP